MRRAVVSMFAASLLLAPILVAQTDLQLIQPESIQYLGAFRLAENWGPDYTTWEFSNGPMAYYPAGDPGGPADGYPGSLFIAGHVYASKVAEVEIPAPVVSRTLSALAVAGLRQSMTDVTAGVPQKNGFIMGMTYVPSQDRIFFTHGQDYSDSDCVPSDSPPGLGSFKPVLSSPQTQGLWFLRRGTTTLHPFTSLRYIMEVPPVWADRLQGRMLATGRHRGWCPEGTNLYASAPWMSADLTPGVTVPANPLMEFGEFTDPPRWSKEHSSANAYQGGAWLTSGDRAAVIVTGIIDYDPSRSYYGYDAWKFPSQCDPDPASRGCTGSRGWRAADPRPAILLFDPRDMADVDAGIKPAWGVGWYAKLDLTPYMFRNYTPTMLTTSADAEDLLATFDRARGLLYISESFVDGMKPIVHVFRVGGPVGPPGVPKNVRIIR